MITRIIQLQSKTYWVGIIFLIASVFAFMIYPEARGDDSSGYFIVNFGLTVAYLIVFLVNKHEIHASSRIHHWTIFIALLLVSAWTLNRTMPVFELSVTWMAALQAMVCIALILVSFHRFLPANEQQKDPSFEHPLFRYKPVLLFLS